MEVAIAQQLPRLNPHTRIFTWYDLFYFYSQSLARLFTNGTVIWIKMWVTTWRTSATSPRLEQGYSVTKTFDVITKSKLFPKTVSASASGTKIIANLSKRKTFFLFSNIFSVFVGPSRCVRIHCHNNYFLRIWHRFDLSSTISASRVATQNSLLRVFSSHKLRLR